MIIRLVNWLLSLTGYPYAFTYKIPCGWKTYISCPPNKHVMNGLNDAWKRAMQTERKKLTKEYRRKNNE